MRFRENKNLNQIEIHVVILQKRYRPPPLYSRSWVWVLIPIRRRYKCISNEYHRMGYIINYTGLNGVHLNRTKHNRKSIQLFLLLDFYSFRSWTQKNGKQNGFELIVCYFKMKMELKMDVWLRMLGLCVAIFRECINHLCDFFVWPIANNSYIIFPFWFWVSSI